MSWWRRAAGLFVFLLLISTSAMALPTAAEQDVEKRISVAQAIDFTKDIDASEKAWDDAIAAARALDPPNVRLLATALAGKADPDYYRANKMPNSEMNAGFEQALVPQLEARDLLRQAGLTHTDLYISLMSNIGAFYAPLPDYPKAEEAQREGIAIGEEMYGKDATQLSHNYFNLGMLLYREKQLGAAADCVRKSSEIRYGTEPELPDTVSALATAAQINAEAGRPDDAEALALKAVTLAQAHLPESHPWYGYALYSLGEAYRRKGHYADALPLLRRGLDLLVANAGKNHVFTYRALVALAQTLGAQGRFDEARALLEPYRTFAKAVDLTVTLRTEIARDEAETGRMDEALASIDDAISYTNGKTYSPDGSLGKARALEFKADLLMAKGDAEGGRAAAQEAVSIYEAQLPPDAPQLQSARTLLNFVSGPESYAGLVETARALETTLFDTASPDDRSTQFARYRDPFVRLALAAHLHGDDETTFHALELASFNPVTEASARAAIRQSSTPEQAAGLLDRLETLQRQATALRVQRDQAYMNGNAALGQSLAVELDDVGAQVTRLAAQVRAAFPVYDALSRPDHTSLADVQKRLKSDETILIVIPGMFSTTVARISRHRLDVTQKPLSHAELRRLVTGIRASLVPDAMGQLPPFDSLAASDLYRALFVDEGHDSLAGTSRLYVMALDEAGQVPYSLLLTQATPADAPLNKAPWLVRRMSIATLASFAAAAEDGGQTDVSFMGVGAPLLTGMAGGRLDVRGLRANRLLDLGAISALPALPGTAQELQRLRAGLHSKDGVLLLGDQAREPALQPYSGRTIGVLAFATHGLFSGDVTGLSEPALVLTPPQEVTAKDDGLLSASDIMTLGLRADWVVLSACNSAAGSTDSSAGFRGLAQAFFYGGAHTLLVSHWEVRDDVAPELTVLTVTSGREPAEALRRAELNFIDDRLHVERNHPALWAAFSVITTLKTN